MGFFDFLKNKNNDTAEEAASGKVWPGSDVLVVYK